MALGVTRFPDIRALLRADPGVHQGLIVASLADFSDSSLRVQILYFTSDPDWESHMAVRERVNFAILRSCAARGVTLTREYPDVMASSARAIRIGVFSKPGRETSSPIDSISTRQASAMRSTALPWVGR